MPIPVRGVLVQAMPGTELSRVRTEFRLRLPETINKSPLESTADIVMQSSGLGSEWSRGQSNLRIPPSLTSAVSTAWPAARPAHSFLKFRAYPLDVLPSGFRFLDRDNPANPLIACQGRNILPLSPCPWVRNENPS